MSTPLARGIPYDSRPIPQSNLKELAAARIRERIFAGEMRPGSKVDQDALAADLGISKLPVREALIALDGEGLVNIVARRGAYIAPLTREDVLDHYLLFGIIAGVAAERAAHNMEKAELDRLRRLLKDMAAVSDPQTQAQLNDDFHRAINVAGQSRRLASVLKLLGRSLPSRFYEFHTDWAPNANHDHRGILDALQKRDAERAARLMREHLRKSGEHAVKFLESTGFWDEEDAASVEPK